MSRMLRSSYILSWIFISRRRFAWCFCKTIIIDLNEKYPIPYCTVNKYNISDRKTNNEREFLLMPKDYEQMFIISRDIQYFGF